MFTLQHVHHILLVFICSSFLVKSLLEPSFTVKDRFGGCDLATGTCFKNLCD